MPVPPGKQPGTWTAGRLAFVHGYSCSSEHWSEAPKRLGDRYDVRLISLPGHDRTDLPGERSLDIDACADHILAALEAGPGTTYLIGHSLGGMVGIVCAWRRPELLSGLVLVDAFPKLGQPPPFDKSFWPGTPPALKSHVVKEMMRTRRKLPSSLWESVVAFDGRPLLQRLQIPVAGIYGDRGVNDHEALRKALLEAPLARLPGIRPRLVPQAGHFVMLEQPDAFYRLLSETLEDMTGGISHHAQEAR